MKEKLKYIIILIIILLFIITFFIIKNKENIIDNWNIIKYSNNDEIEEFKNIKNEVICDSAKKILSENNYDNEDIKKSIIVAVCNKKESKKGKNIRQRLSDKLKEDQEDLNKRLRENNG